MTDSAIQEQVQEMERQAAERGIMIVVYVTHRKHCLIGKEGQCNCRPEFREVSAGPLE